MSTRQAGVFCVDNCMLLDVFVFQDKQRFMQIQNQFQDVIESLVSQLLYMPPPPPPSPPAPPLSSSLH